MCECDTKSPQSTNNTNKLIISTTFWVTASIYFLGLLSKCEIWFGFCTTINSFPHHNVNGALAD